MYKSYNSAGYHVTFVNGNNVSQQMVFAIFYISFKLLLIYHVPGKQIPISTALNFPILLSHFSIYTFKIGDT